MNQESRCRSLYRPHQSLSTTFGTSIGIAAVSVHRDCCFNCAQRHSSCDRRWSHFGAGSRLERCVRYGGSSHTILDVLSTRFGVTDRVHEWFSSYLSGRTQVISSLHTRALLRQWHLRVVCHKAQSSVQSSSPRTPKSLTNSLRRSMLNTIFMQTTSRCSHICVSAKSSRKSYTVVCFEFKTGASRSDSS